MEPGRGPAEVEFFCDRQERDEVSEIDLALHGTSRGHASDPEKLRVNTACGDTEDTA